MFRLLVCLSLAASALAQLGLYQNVLHDHGDTEHSGDSGSGRIDHGTTMHLSALSSNGGFVALSHQRFPAHRVRVKKTKFCDPTVKYAPPKSIIELKFDALNLYLCNSVYTGYLDVDYGAKHMFFYFFESRRDPENGTVPLELCSPSCC